MIIDYSFGKRKFDVKNFLLNNHQTKDLSLIDKTGPNELYHCSDNENSFTLGVESLNKLIKNYYEFKVN